MESNDFLIKELCEIKDSLALLSLDWIDLSQSEKEEIKILLSILKSALKLVSQRIYRYDWELTHTINNHDSFRVWVIADWILKFEKSILSEINPTEKTAILNYAVNVFGQLVDAKRQA